MLKKLKEKILRRFIRVEYVELDTLSSPPSILYVSYEPLLNSTRMALTITQRANGKDTMVRQFIEKDFESLCAFLVAQRVGFQIPKYYDAEEFARRQMDSMQQLGLSLIKERNARYEAESRERAAREEVKQLIERLMPKSDAGDE